MPHGGRPLQPADVQVDCAALFAASQVVCVDDGMPSWVCEVCVSKPTVRQAIELVKQVEKDLALPIKPATVAA